ncbi:hypothetical protein [Bradyrhizobium sp. CCBAU 45389]|uniref:hypothetical protein n=1 Tax=Bradyrhizobium sp. CCBAU 45389 TaxID=858429 RepID=UPI0023061E3A|nr:hypothetical protein [Bradyrhizobium sp. CCBAU 45389]
MDSTYVEPWRQVTDARERRLLEEELTKEAGDGHPLVGWEITVLARRDDCDDILVSSGNGRLAEVHLTWSGKREARPSWPRTVIFESMEEWRAKAADDLA